MHNHECCQQEYSFVLDPNGWMVFFFFFSLQLLYILLSAYQLCSISAIHFIFCVHCNPKSSIIFLSNLYLSFPSYSSLLTMVLFIHFNLKKLCNYIHPVISLCSLFFKSILRFLDLYSRFCHL